MAGLRSSSACSIARVTSTVLAPYWPLMWIITPCRPMMVASPIFGSAPLATKATSFRRMVWPFFAESTTSPSSAGVTDWPCVWSTTRCASVSMKPAPRTPVALRAAETTSESERPAAARRSGWSWICNWRISPPKMATRATPFTPSRRGRMVQSAKVRSSMRVRVSEVRPTISVRLVAPTSGAMDGAWTPCGSWAAASDIRSETIWRARYTSIWSSKVAVTTDRPWMELERSAARLGVPFNEDSMGRVTRLSTSCEERPGASVWTTTWGGANSG